MHPQRGPSRRATPDAHRDEGRSSEACFATSDWGTLGAGDTRRRPFARSSGRVRARIAAARAIWLPPRSPLHRVRSPFRIQLLLLLGVARSTLASPRRFEEMRPPGPHPRWSQTTCRGPRAVHTGLASCAARLDPWEPCHYGTRVLPPAARRAAGGTVARRGRGGTRSST